MLATCRTHCGLRVQVLCLLPRRVGDGNILFFVTVTNSVSEENYVARRQAERRTQACHGDLARVMLFHHSFEHTHTTLL